MAAQETIVVETAGEAEAGVVFGVRTGRGRGLRIGASIAADVRRSLAKFTTFVVDDEPIARAGLRARVTAVAKINRSGRYGFTALCEFRLADECGIGAWAR